MKLTEQVQVVIEESGFRDALYLSKEDRAAMTDEEIAARAKARYDAHLERLSKPVEVVPLTEEQVAARLDDLVRQKAAIDAELGTVDPVKLDESYTRTGIEKGDEVLEPVAEPIVRVK
jgi:hypothetical protein